MIEQYEGQEITTGVVRFTADWCVPCKSFQPVFDGVGSGVDVPFYAIDIEHHMELAREQRVMSIPAVFIVEDGYWTQFDGTPSAQQLAEAAVSLDNNRTNW